MKYNFVSSKAVKNGFDKIRKSRRKYLPNEVRKEESIQQDMEDSRKTWGLKKVEDGSKQARLK